MTQIIEIEGDLVTLVEKNILHTIQLEEFLPRIENRPPINLSLLPSNPTRAVYYDSSNNTAQRLFVLNELPPAVRTIQYAGRQLTLTMPWTRFVFFLSSPNGNENGGDWTFQDYRIFWSRNAFRNAAAEDMIAAFLPNVYTEGRICFGSTGASPNQTLAARLDQTINEFYSSGFNNDLSIYIPAAFHDNYAEWEEASTIDPTCWLTWDELNPESPAPRRRPRFSWDSIVAEMGTSTRPRFEPVIQEDTIPPLELLPTFGGTDEWLTRLNNTQRQRLLNSITALNTESPHLFGV